MDEQTPDPARQASGNRAARMSFLLLVGVPIGIVFLTIWSVIVRTSPTLDTDDRIRGWSTVLRELPATLLLLAVVVGGMLLAVRAGRRGAVRPAVTAIWWHGAALLFVLVVLGGNGADNVTTTRSATVKWLLLPIEVALAAGAVFLARRAVLGHAVQSSRGSTIP